MRAPTLAGEWWPYGVLVTTSAMNRRDEALVIYGPFTLVRGLRPYVCGTCTRPNRSFQADPPEHHEDRQDGLFSDVE